MDETGFLEESPGHKSSKRLAGLITLALIAAMVLTACTVALKHPDAAVGIIAALGGFSTPLMGGVWAIFDVTRRSEQETTTTTAMSGPPPVVVTETTTPTEPVG